MKKILNLITAAIVCMVLAVSCNDDDTASFTFYGFNPNPAVRGEKLTLHGQGMANLRSVLFAGGKEAPVEDATCSVASVTIPMDAMAGVVTLNFTDGSYTTQTVLNFEEQLAADARLKLYTDFENKSSEATEIGRKVYIVTENLTDYLSNIERVEFAGDEAVVEFDPEAFTAANGYAAVTDAELVALSEQLDFVRSGHLLIVTIPQSAKSGAVMLYDSNDDRYIAPEVTIAQSMADDITPRTGVIPGTTRLTVTGENFDLVTGVAFAGNVTVALDEKDTDGNPMVTVNAAGTVLTVRTKIGMQDGPLSLTTLSGDVIATPSVETAVPTRFTVTAPEGYKAGKPLTLSCHDTESTETNYLLLSQIRQILFYGADGTAIESIFTLDNEQQRLTTTIPATAVDGKIEAVTHAGKTTTAVAALSLAKASLDPTHLNAPIEVTAGDPVTLRGSHLDLVNSVKIGDTACEFTHAADGTLEIATTRTMTSGKLTLAQENGVLVATGDNGIEVTLLPAGFIVVTSMPASAAPGAEITIEGTNFNKIESIYIGTSKVTGYTFRSDTRLSFIVPLDAPAGTHPLTFNLTDGSTETSAQTINLGTMQKVETTIFETATVLPAGWSNAARLDSGIGFDLSVFANCTTESIFTIYLSDITDNGQIQIKDSSWGTLLSANDPASGWDGVNLSADQTSYSFTVNEADLAKLKSGGMIIGGQNVTITRISITETKVVPPSAEKTIFEMATVLPAGWGTSVILVDWNGFDLSLLADCTTETVFTVYYTDCLAGPQISIKDPANGWTAYPSANTTDWGGVDLDPSQNCYTFSFDATDLAGAKANGLIIGGQNVTITKVTIK